MTQMPDHDPIEVKVTSLDFVLSEWMTAWPDAVPADDSALVDLRTRLIDREENMKTILGLAAQQWAIFPHVAPEFFAIVGLGEPLDDETRALIHAQYHEDLVRASALAEQWRREHPDDPGIPT